MESSEISTCAWCILFFLSLDADQFAGGARFQPLSTKAWQISTGEAPSPCRGLGCVLESHARLAPRHAIRHHSIIKLGFGAVMLQQPLPVRVVSPVERTVALSKQLPKQLVGLVPHFQSLPLRDGRPP